MTIYIAKYLNTLDNTTLKVLILETYEHHKKNSLKSVYKLVILQHVYKSAFKIWLILILHEFQNIYPFFLRYKIL